MKEKSLYLFRGWNYGDENFHLLKELTKEEFDVIFNFLKQCNKVSSGSWKVYDVEDICCFTPVTDDNCWGSDMIADYNGEKMTWANKYEANKTRDNLIGDYIF